MIVGQDLLNKIIDMFINPLILLVFTAGLVLFMWGMFQYMRSLDDSTARTNGRQHMLWGIVGMFIMVAVKGLILLTLDAFGINLSNSTYNGGAPTTQQVNPFNTPSNGG